MQQKMEHELETGMISELGEQGTGEEYSEILVPSLVATIRCTGYKLVLPREGAVGQSSL